MKRVSWGWLLKSERRKKVKEAVGLGTLALIFLVGGVEKAEGQNSEAPPTKMAPLEQYLMDRKEEISLAESAAPAAISQDAEIMVLGRRGYETAAKGKNGFVCVVERSWAAGIDDPEFWNPKLKGPMCFNPAAVRSRLLLTIKKTEWILSGQSKEQMFESVKNALEKKELPTPEPGAMCYMMSKRAYFGAQFGHFVPHLMFFVPPTEDAAWGAGLPGSPVRVFQDTPDRLTVFLIPVGKWSDGEAAPVDPH
jgi:hypothetical protein